MIIDEKGKLFGKINLIDLIIIVVLVLAVAIIGYKFLGNKTTTSEMSKVEVKYFGEEAPSYVCEKVKVGDKLMDEAKNVELGTVTNVEIKDSVSYAANDKGEIVKSKKEGYNSIMITSEVSANPFEHGIYVGSSKYYVGHTFTLLAGKGKFYLKVYDINEK